MNFYCLGINHRTAPLETREKLWFSAEEIRSVVPSLRQKQVDDCVLVSTCNRTELYYTIRDGSANGEPLWMRLAGHKQALGAVREEHFYMIPSLNAVKHLFNVASGIDSMILGDIQIVSQIRDAYAIARSLSATGAVTNRIFDSALRIAKRARTETEISEGAVSLSYAAAELSSKIFSDLSKRTALLIGSGDTGKLTARHLVGKNIGTLLLANRTRQHAEDLAALLRGRVIDFDRIAAELEAVDIVISSINAPSYILSEQDLRRAMKLRGARPLFIIDIGVPRNIDPAANSIESVFLHNLDTLNFVVGKNLRHRESEVPKIRRIILGELIQFNRWHASLEANPTIEELRERLEQIRRQEVEHHLRRFSPLDQEEIDVLTKRIVNKILHTPTVNLKNGTDTHQTMRDKISLVRHLFGLDKRNTE